MGNVIWLGDSLDHSASSCLSFHSHICKIFRFSLPIKVYRYRPHSHKFHIGHISHFAYTVHTYRPHSHTFHIGHILHFTYTVHTYRPHSHMFHIGHILHFTYTIHTYRPHSHTFHIGHISHNMLHIGHISHMLHIGHIYSTHNRQCVHIHWSTTNVRANKHKQKQTVRPVKSVQRL